MSNHNGNANKMVDTPRMDSVAGHARGIVDAAILAEGMKLERELNAANDRIQWLEDWKQSALAVEREWDANAIATMLGGKLGESQREVIQREVPKLLARINRLEAAVKAYQHAYTPDGHVRPHDCFATGPRLGDRIQDLIVCPGCWAEKKAKEDKP